MRTECAEAVWQRVRTECAEAVWQWVRTECAEAVWQWVRTECARRRPSFTSVRKTDSESDVESDTDTESVVVDESADSVVWDAVQPGDRLRTRRRLETDQTMLVEFGNQGGDG